MKSGAQQGGLVLLLTTGGVLWVSSADDRGKLAAWNPMGEAENTARVRLWSLDAGVHAIKLRALESHPPPPGLSLAHLDSNNGPVEPVGFWATRKSLVQAPHMKSALEEVPP